MDGRPGLGSWLDQVRRQLIAVWQGLMRDARRPDRQDAVPVCPPGEAGEQIPQAPPPALPQLEPAQDPWRLLRVREQTGFSFDVALGGAATPSGVTLAGYRLQATPGTVEWRGELLVLGKVEAGVQSPVSRVSGTYRHRLPAGEEQWHWSYPQVRLLSPEAGGPAARVTVEGYVLEPVLLPVYHPRHDGLTVRGERPLGTLTREVLLSTHLPWPIDGVVRSGVVPRGLAFQAGDGKVVAQGWVDHTTVHSSGDTIRQHVEELAFTESWPAPGVQSSDVIEEVKTTAWVMDSWERGLLRQQARLAITVALYRPEFREIAASLQPGATCVPVLARVQVGEPLTARCTWVEQADGPGQVLDVELEVKSVEAQVGERQVGLSGSAFQKVLYLGADGLVHLLERRTRFHQTITCEDASPGMAAHLLQVQPSGVRLAGSRDVRWQVRVELELGLSCERVVYVPGLGPALTAATKG